MDTEEVVEEVARLAWDGCLVLTATIIAYDLLAIRRGHPTITAQIKGVRKVGLAAWGALTLHLFGPRWCDPLWPATRLLYLCPPRKG
jgi:hypothetical protein